MCGGWVAAWDAVANTRSIGTFKCPGLTCPATMSSFVPEHVGKLANEYVLHPQRPRPQRTR
jgi:hypothetical protein